MLEVSNIIKQYGDKTALQEISFRVEQGEVVGFLGTNGAGKSTMMNIITGYLSATSGTVTVDGFDILTSPAKVKSRIGYLPEIPPVYNDLTVWENLQFSYDLKKPRMDRKAHLEEICGLVKITDVKDRLVRNLSKGYRQRVGIACALIGDPPILLFDEPTVGLDPKQIIEIRALIQELSKTRTVILSSHILQEIQAVCGRVIIINRGVIVADDTPENLTTKSSQELHLLLEAKGTQEEIRSALENVSGTLEIVTEELPDGLCRCMLNTGGEDLREQLFFALAQKGLPILELHDRHATLEDVFLRLTQEIETTLHVEETEGASAENAKEASVEDQISETDANTEATEGDDSNDSNL